MNRFSTKMEEGCGYQSRAAGNAMLSSVLEADVARFVMNGGTVKQCGYADTAEPIPVLSPLARYWVCSGK